MRYLTVLAVLLAVLLAILSAVFGQTYNLGNVSNVMKTSFGTGVPTAACTVGMQYFQTDAAAGSNMYLCTSTNVWTPPPVHRTFGCAFDGGGAAIAVSSVCYTRLPRAGTIVGYSIIANGAAPTATIDIWKVADGVALPANGDTITGGQEAALAAGNAIHTVAAGDIAKWNKAIAAYDIAAINVDACATATWMQVLIYYVEVAP